MLDPATSSEDYRRISRARNGRSNTATDRPHRDPGSPSSRLRWRRNPRISFGSGQELLFSRDEYATPGGTRDHGTRGRYRPGESPDRSGGGRLSAVATTSHHSNRTCHRM